MRLLTLLLVFPILLCACSSKKDEAKKPPSPTKKVTVKPPVTIHSSKQVFTPVNSWIEVEQQHNDIFILLDLDMPDSLAFPEVWSEREERMVEAKELQVKVIGSSKKNPDFKYELETTVKYNYSYTNQQTNKTYYSYDIEIALRASDLKDLKSGDNTLFFEVETELFYEWMSEFIKTGIKPFEFSFSFPTTIEPIYATQIHFERLEFNQEEVDKYLGEGNDFVDPRPEAQLLILLNEEEFLRAFEKNSYVIEEPDSAFIYHNNKNDKITIQLNDFDYGFNEIDYLETIKKPIQNLVGPTFINIESWCCDKLLLRCDSTFQYNK